MTDEKVKEARERLTLCAKWCDAKDMTIRGAKHRAAFSADVHAILSDHAALQAERDKLEGEVERAQELTLAAQDIAFKAQERTASAQQHAIDIAAQRDAAEDKLTALVEALGEIADEDDAEISAALKLAGCREIARQALAHHSAPVGEPVLTGWPKTTKPKQDVREFVASLSAPPSTPTSAPVEDVGTIEKIARIIDPEAWAEHDAQKAETAPYRGPIRLIAARVVEGSLAKAESILAARSLSLIQPEPAAWRYETPTGVFPTRGRAGGWVWQVSETLPDMPEGWARNLTPLYALSASPALIQPQGEERS